MRETQTSPTVKPPFLTYQIGKEPRCWLRNPLANALGTSVLMYVGEKGYWLNSLECDFEMPVIATDIHTPGPSTHSKIISQIYPHTPV